MFKSLFFLIVLFGLSNAASAEWVAGVGYANLSDDEDGIDISVGTIAGSLGYRFPSTSNFSIMPELRIGFGVNDDTVDFGGLPFDVEVKSFVALSVRGQYEVNDSFYVYAQPSYANLDIEVSALGMSASDDDDEFGFGAGLGLHFNDHVSGEAAYEYFDGTDVFSIGIKYAF